MTIKLYYTSPSITSWKTTITSSQKDGDTYIVTLAETAFYPEGGGQPSDCGTIEAIPVMDVFEENGEVYHRLSSLPASSSVHCEIDAQRRWDHTQQHSGQHLLSAVCIELLDAHTKSFHLGRDIVSIDLDTPALSEQQLLAIEDQANMLIYNNIPIKTYYVSQEEAKKLPFRKLPELDGDIRVVEIQGIDISACCGTHVSRTGEIGIIKLLKTEKHRGMTRLFFKCGRRALDDYQTSHRLLTSLSQHFGAHREMLANVLYKLEAENKEYQKQLQHMKQMMARIEAKGIVQEANDSSIVFRIYEDLPSKDLQIIASEVVTHYQKTAILATKAESRLIIVKSPSHSFHAGNVLKQQLEATNGKGGGNDRQAQAVFPTNDELISFIQQLQNGLSTHT
ncbi:DHHA1 domain-containing protein [Anoxybacillus rupiensis]|uniref:DHHA1 domain-containing protein n=1 Tax=Anoxybacteroides rupiense TaxID=311460 RepID=A0ABT5W4S9_9BACL|nr:DHHA1 domain-containing protein [Anoxybacillus rupiensis]MDE8563814.1 DHHA1 domain-containing protein [Anoxybacillus rupiensis]